MKDRMRRRGKRAALCAGLLVLTQALGGCFLAPDPTLDPLAIDPNQTPIPFGPTETARSTLAPTPQPSAGTAGGWEDWAPVEHLPTPGPTPTPIAAKPTATPSSWKTSTDDYYAGYPVLKVGSTGSDVSDMQTRLKELGYYTGSVDGRFAGGTQDAVKAFQSANGLTADGIAGRATQDKLYSTGAVAKTITTSGTTSTYSLLKDGSYGTEVRKLQARLTELGYYAGGVDGVYGSSTESAVKSFQRANGLSADGQAGEATQKKLYSSSAKSNSRPVTTADPTAKRSLTVGMEGNDVYGAQERLIALGYLTGVADGVFGAETESAVVAFQKRNNLTADGVVGASTLKKLNSSGAKKAATASATATPKPGTYVVIREGDSGTLVFDLQERLYELGYYSGRVDGRFGAGTTAAVKAFQTANGLSSDGIAGQATQKKLYASDAKFNPDLIGNVTPVKPTATPGVSTDKLLKRGSTGDDVRRLQQALLSLGYYEGQVDGTYGASTEAAVRLFQTYNDMRADGVAGAQTLTTLYGGHAAAHPGEQARPTATPQGSYATLKEGDVSEQVRLMQKRLYALGYLPEYLTDGDFGERTVEAVKNFQRRNGLTDDGVAGPGTLAILYASSALPYQSGETSSGDVELDALKTGSQGDEVTQMQKALADIGCYMGTADGIFGATTATAVKLFQALNNLTPDGVAGRETLALLYSGDGKGIRNLTLTDLSIGATGEAVKALQIMLISLGYLQTEDLGTFGNLTAAAVVRFQNAYGLEQTGVATVAMQTLLYSGQAAGGPID